MCSRRSVWWSEIDGGLASAFPAVRSLTSALIPNSFTVYIHWIGRSVGAVVAAGTAVWCGRQDAAYVRLVRALLDKVPT